MRGHDWSSKEPGVNVLVLTEMLDAGGQMAKGFDIRESLDATNRLADYINAVAQGRTVRKCTKCNINARTSLQYHSTSLAVYYTWYISRVSLILILYGIFI